MTRCLRALLVRTRSAEQGSAIVEFTLLTLVLIVPVFYLVLAVFHVQGASFGATAASMAGARAYIQSADLNQAERQWRQAINITLADHGLENAEFSRRCIPQCFVSGSTVEVRVKVKQPLPFTPRVFGKELAAITVESTHREPFGKYRANAN